MGIPERIRQSGALFGKPVSKETGNLTRSNALTRGGVKTMAVKSSAALMAGSLAIAMSLLGIPGAVAEEIRIGFIAPITGPFAQAGKDMVNGWEMYADEVKNDFAGAAIKFILEDDQAKPPVGVLKAEKLIRQDKVHMIMGGVLASTGYALAPVSTREKTVYMRLLRRRMT
jgi:branched-chain amino acid transport system substrate-binding protein